MSLLLAFTSLSLSFSLPNTNNMTNSTTTNNSSSSSSSSTSNSPDHTNSSSKSTTTTQFPLKSSQELESVYNMLLERIDDMESALKMQICLLTTKRQALQEQGRHLKTRLGMKVDKRHS